MTPTTFARKALRRARRDSARALRAAEGRASARFGVLAYHRVGPTDFDPWHLGVTAEHFEQHLRVASELGRIVPLAAESRRSRWSRLARRGTVFAVTFDDGYVDNLRVVLPIAERYDAPFTVFVVPGFLGRAHFWWDRLASVVLRAGDPSVVVDAWHSAGNGRLSLDPGAGLEAHVLHSALYELVVSQPVDVSYAMVDGLAAHLGATAPEPELRPLDRAELLSLAAHPLVTIGCHTLQHRRLRTLDPAAVRAEVVNGDRELDRLLGPERVPRVVAYPFGNADRETAAAVGRAGYDIAFTTQPRWVSLADRKLLMPRLDARDITGDEFRAWLKR